MSFSTGLKLGRTLFTGRSVGVEPYRNPEDPFFHTGGFFLEDDPNDSNPDLQENFDDTYPYARVGVIPCAGAKSVLIQPLMRVDRTTAVINDDDTAVASDITDNDKRVGFDVYAAKPIGDPALSDNNDRMVWPLGFIQTVSWTKGGFSLAAFGTEITHPEDGHVYAPMANGGVADVSQTPVAKTIAHIMPATMSSATTAQPDITDGFSTDYTGTADTTFCNVVLGPFADCLYLSPSLTDDNLVKRNGLVFSYRFAILY
mgnify:FL=1